MKKPKSGMQYPNIDKRYAGQDMYGNVRAKNQKGIKYVVGKVIQRFLDSEVWSLLVGAMLAYIAMC